MGPASARRPAEDGSPALSVDRRGGCSANPACRPGARIEAQRVDPKVSTTSSASTGSPIEMRTAPSGTSSIITGAAVVVIMVMVTMIPATMLIAVRKEGADDDGYGGGVDDDDRCPPCGQKSLLIGTREVLKTRLV